MSTAVAARQIDEIMLDISRLLAKPDVDVLQLRRLELAVQRLWDANSISPVEYYRTKAFFSVGKQQRDHALAAAKNILHLAPCDVHAQLDALTIFVGVLEVDEAIQLIRSLAVTQRDDKDCLKKLIIKGTDLLQFNLVSDLFKTYDSLAVNDSPVQLFRRGISERSLIFMTRLGLTDDDMVARIKTAAVALQKRDMNVFRSSRRTLSDGSILYCMHINAGAEECAELNFDIAEAMVEQYADPSDEFISFVCRPLTDLSTMETLPVHLL